MKTLAAYATYPGSFIGPSAPVISSVELISLSTESMFIITKKRTFLQLLGASSTKPKTRRNLRSTLVLEEKFTHGNMFFRRSHNQNAKHKEYEKF